MGDNRPLDALDAMQIFSLYIGMLNLFENREQSAQNDVGAANDKQASYLLSEIGKRLDSQDRTLDRIVEKLDQLEGRITQDA